MSRLLQLSCAAYGALLLLYPPEFRRRFGPEMADTFARQLADAWTAAGPSGVIEVWSLTLQELFSVAIPLQMTRTAVTIPVVSLVSTSAIFFSLVWALHNSLVLNAWYHGVFGGGRH